MKKFLNLIFMLMLVLIYSCSDQIINNVVDNAEVNQVHKMLMTSDSSTVNLNKPVCWTKDVVMWNLEFYLPKPNKVLGIWSKFASGEEFYSLKNKFGYTKVRVSNETQKNWAIGSGFSLSQ